jgi:hypothetical protein
MDQLWASMSRTGFVNAVSEDGRRRLRVVVVSRVREDHVVERILDSLARDGWPTVTLLF